MDATSNLLLRVSIQVEQHDPIDRNLDRWVEEGPRIPKPSDRLSGRQGEELGKHGWNLASISEDAARAQGCFFGGGAA